MIAPIGVAMASCFLPAHSYGEWERSYYWTGGGVSTDISDPTNWFDELVPNGFSNTLVFEAAGGIVTNNLAEASFDSLIFTAGGYTLRGSKMYSVGFVGFEGAASGDVRFENSIDAAGDFEVEFTKGMQSFTFANTVSMASVESFSVRGTSTFNNVMRLVGANGAMPSFTPRPVVVRNATLSLDNSEGIRTGRVSAPVVLGTGARLLLNGNSSDDVSETINSVSVTGTNIVDVLNPGVTTTNSLTIGAFHDDASSATLFTSTGAGELGGAARIYLGEQSDTGFLGAQYFYLNGQVGGAAARYEYAAYDAGMGIVSATNATNLTTAQAGANVLIGATDTFLGTSNQLNSVAFNGANLYGNGTIHLENLLVTKNLAVVYTDLDFGKSDGTITTANWNLGAYPRIYLAGEISGDRTLTFRGYGEAYALADSDFSGDLYISGGFLNLLGGGRFAAANSLTIESAEDQYSFLRMGGWSGVNPDRLSDAAPVSVSGNVTIALYSDVDPGSLVATTETIGDVTVGGDSALSLLVSDGWTGTSQQNPARPGALTLASLTFGESEYGSTLRVTVKGANNAITIGGGPIEVSGSTEVTLDLQGDGTRIVTGGLILQGEGADVFLYASGQTVGGARASFVGDMNLEGGNFTFEGEETGGVQTGVVAIEGDFTMGGGLNFNLSLGAPDDGMTAIFSLDGDLTIGGNLFISLYEEYTLGRWLLFDVSGSIVDLGWYVSGYEGAYTYAVEGNKVYLDAIGFQEDFQGLGEMTVLPEPSTWALLVVGAGVLLLAVRRRRVA